TGNDIRVEFKMPTEAVVGSSVELKCEWRILGVSNLYSVKWYKDDHEFFRYVPDNNPKTQMFPRAGVKVEKRSSSEKSNNQKSIRLKDLVLESSGQYKCEVSTEAPFFATTFETANLTVISPPERGPEITGLSSHYAVNENVTANCTSWPSVPKANLRWTINGESVKYPSLPTRATCPEPSSTSYSCSDTRSACLYVLAREMTPHLSRIERIKHEDDEIPCRLMLGFALAAESDNASLIHFDCILVSSTASRRGIVMIKAVEGRAEIIGEPSKVQSKEDFR
ncbi:hypothetical protein HN011_012347, partial [Eciton burchellii]